MPGFDDLDTLRDAVSYAPTRRPIHDQPGGDQRFHDAAMDWLQDDAGLQVQASGDRPLHLVGLGDDEGLWLSVYAVPVAELRQDQSAALGNLNVGAVFRLALDGLTPAERAGALWLLVGSGNRDAADEADRLGAGTGIDTAALRATLGAFERHEVGGTLDGRIVAVTTVCLAT